MLFRHSFYLHSMYVYTHLYVLCSICMTVSTPLDRWNVKLQIQLQLLECLIRIMNQSRIVPSGKFKEGFGDVSGGTFIIHVYLQCMQECRLKHCSLSFRNMYRLFSWYVTIAPSNEPGHRKWSRGGYKWQHWRFPTNCNLPKRSWWTGKGGVKNWHQYKSWWY